jgi:hypothetical protein
VQGDLGQPRAKCARSGDEEAEAAFLAQRGLEIMRFAEYRDNATRPFVEFMSAWHVAGSLRECYPRRRFVAGDLGSTSYWEIGSLLGDQL